MRLISQHTDGPEAERFVAFLKHEKFDVVLEQDGDNEWSVWARDENEITQVHEQYERFAAEPQHDRYTVPVEPDATTGRQTTRRTKRVRGNRPLTWTLILLYGLVFTIQSSESYHPGNTVMSALSLRNPTEATSDEAFTAKFSNVLQGEVWRLVTPIFLYGGSSGGVSAFLLMLVSFFILLALATAAERRMRTSRFALLILAIAVTSTIGQGLLAETARDAAVPWGGLLSLIYGLFGFVWIKVSFEPKSGFELPPPFMYVAMAFLILGALDSSSSFAQWTHVISLVSGMTMGVMPITLPERPESQES